MNMLDTRWVRFAAGAVAAMLLPACGYALDGKGNAYPAGWVIGVPPIVNQSTVPEVEVALTDAVRAEFQSHGKYKTVPQAEGADAVFTATVRSVRSDPIAVNTSTRQALRYKATVTAEVTFKDKAGKTLYSNRAAQFTEEYDVASSTQANDPSNYFGQNRDALQRLAKNFAESIVSSILSNF